MKTLAALLFMTASLCWGTAYTASQTGNFNVAATWGGAGVPTWGDTFSTANFAVTVPNGYTAKYGTCHNSFPSGTLDGQVGATGSLITAGGGILAPRGETIFHGSINDGLSSFLTFQTGSKVTTDCATTAPTTFYPEAEGHWTHITLGTLGDAFHTVADCASTTCTRITTTGSNIVMWNGQGSTWSNLILDDFGGTIDHCGTTTQGCFDNNVSAGIGGVTAEVYLDNSYWENTAGVRNQAGFAQDPAYRYIVRRTVFKNDIYAGGGSIYVNLPFTISYTGTHEISDSLLAIGDELDGTGPDFLPAFAGQNDVFTSLFLSAGNLTASAVWSLHDFVVIEPNCIESSHQPFLLGDIQNVTLVCTFTVGNTQLFGFLNSVNGISVTVSDLVLDFIGPTASITNGMHCSYPDARAGASSWVERIWDVVITVATSVSPTQQTCHLFGMINDSSSHGTLNIQHVTQPGDFFNGSLVMGETGYILVTGFIPVYKNNLFYSFSGTGSDDPMTIAGSVPGSQPANVATPSGVDYNNNYNANLTNSNRWVVGFNSNCNPCTTPGTAYDYPATVTVPGVHDTALAPQLFDPTRNSLKWAATQGQPATIAGVTAAFYAVPPAQLYSSIRSLHNYIKAGHSTANTSLTSSGSDGLARGALAPSIGHGIMIAP